MCFIRGYLLHPWIFACCSSLRGNLELLARAGVGSWKETRFIVYVFLGGICAGQGNRVTFNDWPLWLDPPTAFSSGGNVYAKPPGLDPDANRNAMDLWAHYAGPHDAFGWTKRCLCACVCVVLPSGALERCCRLARLKM